MEGKKMQKGAALPRSTIGDDKVRKYNTTNCVYILCHIVLK